MVMKVMSADLSTFAPSLVLVLVSPGRVGVVAVVACRPADLDTWRCGDKQLAVPPRQQGRKQFMQ